MTLFSEAVPFRESVNQSTSQFPYTRYDGTFKRMNYRFDVALELSERQVAREKDTVTRTHLAIGGTRQQRDTET